MNKRVELKNKKLIENYKDNLLGVKLTAQNTVDAYVSDLIMLGEYIDQDFTTCKEDKLQEYRRYMIHDVECKGKKGYSQSTVSRKVAAIRDFYSFLQNERIMGHNPATDLKPVKLPKRQRHYLSQSLARELVQSTQTQAEPLKSRDKLMLTMFLTLGLRLEEMTDVRLSNISGNFIYITGKGNKERKISLNPSVVNALNDYLRVRGSDNNHLLLTRGKKPLSRSGVRYTVNKYFELTGIDTDKFSTHNLRHTAATLMHKNKVDIKTLQNILGHSDIKTTQIYVHVDDDQLQQAANIMDGIFD